MGLKLNNKKYQMLVGYPSGEVLYLPINIINKLKGYVYTDTIYDGVQIIKTFMFSDEDYQNIIDLLSLFDNDEW